MNQNSGIGKYIFENEFQKIIRENPEGNRTESGKKHLFQEGGIFAPGFVKVDNGDFI